MPNNKSQKSSLLGCLVWIAVKCAIWILLGLFVAILVACLIIMTQGQQGGYHKLTALLDFQQLYLSKISTSFLVNKGNLIVQWLAAKNHALWDINTRTNLSRVEILNQLAKQFIGVAKTYGCAMLLSIEIAILKMVTILLYWPLFILVGAIGFIDGAVQRYLRRITGGRESTLIYHYAKISIIPVIFLVTFIYVVVPATINPELFLFPCAITASFLLYLTTKTFKKYL